MNLKQAIGLIVKAIVARNEEKNREEKVKSASIEKVRLEARYKSELLTALKSAVKLLDTMDVVPIEIAKEAQVFLDSVVETISYSDPIKVTRDGNNPMIFNVRR